MTNRSELNELSQIFNSHPEIKSTIIARRLNISQPLLSAYLHNLKKPSQKRIEAIKAEIRKVGEELTKI